MRYVILGSGAVGGTIGYMLHQAGHDVVLIARGAHLEALQTSGLSVHTAAGVEHANIPAVATPAAANIVDGDVVFLATKTQDTPDALAALTSAASASTVVISAQNGVENERLLIRHFENVYAMCVILPAAHVEPGAIECYGSPWVGILDLGRYPTEVDEFTHRMAGLLERAGFRSRADPAIMRMKYAKLIRNLHNAVEALAGPEAKSSDVTERCRQEAFRVLAAAAIEVASLEEAQSRREGFRALTLGEGGDRTIGSSSWQSLMRKLGSIETDYLNGEIVFLGRMYGVPTPANLIVQQQAHRFAMAMNEPGSMTLEELKALIESEVHAPQGS